VTLEFVKAVTLDAAVGALSEPGAVALCGGTDLMVKLRSGALTCKTLVDISEVADLREIRMTSDRLVLGAAVAESEILASEEICARLPLLALALKSLGSSQIRNRGTLGGNLANASPAADGVLALLAYDASVRTVSAHGDRSLPVERLLEGPGRTVLEQGEVIRSIEIDLTRIPETSRAFFHKVGRRKAMTIAVASLGGWAVVEGMTLRGIALAVGSVAPTPLRLRSVEDRLIGRSVGKATADAARAMVCEQVSPIDDVRGTGEYRRRVVGELAAQFIMEFEDA